MIITFILIVSVNLIVTLFFVKALLNIENRVKTLENHVIQLFSTLINPSLKMEDSIASGLVKGIQAIRDEDERHLKLLDMARNLQRGPLPVMNQNSGTKEILDTGGDLIPTNLTKEEREVLQMFYDKRNER